MIALVWNKIAADENSTKPAEIINCKPAISVKKPITIAPSKTKKPIVKNPARKLKSFLVIKAYAERPKNVNAVNPSAFATIDIAPAPANIPIIGPRV